MAHRQFFLPFQKIDREKRIVWVIGQTEIVDLQGDLLTYEASLDAFNKWAGNIREMHEEVAIGKAVQIIPLPRERAILVGAYISKGAENAWQKILDGTYKGSSIGGAPLEAHPIQKNGRRVRKITKYVLDEMSFVDTPANPDCVVRAITKRGNHLVATDVLGHMPKARTASDVLSLYMELQNMPKTIAPLKKRVKIQDLVAFNKSLEKTDETLLLAKASDFTKNADGDFVLKKSAPIAKFTKGEMDADGYDNEADSSSEADSPADIDFEDHANNSASMHKDMCKMAGIDDHVEHYARATGDDGDDGEGDVEAEGDENSVIGKSASAKRRRAAFKKAAQTKLTDTITGLFKTFSEDLLKSVDAKIATVAPVAAARREGAEGTLVKRAADALGTETEGEANDDVVALTKAYRAMNALLLKKASDVDRQERDIIVRDVARLEVTLEKNPALIAQAKADAAKPA